MDKNYLTLELDKILEMLKEETTCDDAAQLALEIKPSTEFSQVCTLLRQTEDAFSLLARWLSAQSNKRQVTKRVTLH